MWQTVGSAIGEVKMERATSFKGSFLIVEGNDDSRFWSSRVADEHCRVVKAGKKEHVVEAVQQLTVAGERGVVGIVDADLDGILTPPIVHPNIVTTDHHDLEAVLLRSSAFRRVLGEFGDRAKIDALERQHGTSLEQAMLDRAGLFARLRWWLRYKNLNIEFERFKVTKYVDPATWTVREAHLLTEVSAETQMSLAEIAVELGACPQAGGWDICHGKDMIDVLAVGFMRLLGSKQPGREKISQVLRSGIPDDELRACKFHQALCAWEAGNPPFKVF